MAIDSDRLLSKRANAIQCIEALVAFLVKHKRTKWADRFREIGAELHRGNDKTAISLHKALPRRGMGSLTDIYIASDAGGDELDLLFQKLVGDASRCLANIRLYLDYDMDRPFVEM